MQTSIFMKSVMKLQICLKPNQSSTMSSGLVSIKFGLNKLEAPAFILAIANNLSKNWELFARTIFGKWLVLKEVQYLLE
jgi:hypothetical protein